MISIYPEVYGHELAESFTLFLGENESHEESVEQNSRASTNQEDSGEETPPPLPPRRRLEAAAADEPETKRSRPVEHGMSKTVASTQKMEKRKNKSQSLFHYLKRKRKMKADSKADRQMTRNCQGSC